ncbi:MAG: HNH endonuclease [Clostridia bacterium]|nr:HNH endonuclease [Clostridia bacterium]
MKITLHTIPIRDLVNGFEDNGEDGIVGYFGKLNIRPAFQREFIYGEKDKIEVINSIFKGFPLNVMYWIKAEGGGYELLDGQQRTLSICSYHEGEFFVKVNGSLKGFHNLTADQKDMFLDYELQVYICEDGTTSEQLDWFQIINMVGKKLTDQELLNALHTGPWLASAKQRFSKTKCVAYQLGDRYMDGQPLRQDYLHTVLKWISDQDHTSIEKYMGTHQHDKNSDREWQYFQNVIHWVETLFPHYRKNMAGIDWGILYNRFKDVEYSASDLEEKVRSLTLDDDVQVKSGIYEYLLSGDERKLNLRGFSDGMKQSAYERQQGICPICGRHFEIDQMEGDHITPWHLGGHTTPDNCQMLCRDCNRRKGGR